MGDTIAQVTDASFQEEVLSSDTPVLVDFWAEWCAPCHMVAPIVEEIARDQAGKLKVAKLNVDDNPAVAMKYAVMSIPTLIMFVGGEAKSRMVGARPKEALMQEIRPHLPADAPVEEAAEPTA